MSKQNYKNLLKPVLHNQAPGRPRDQIKRIVPPLTIETGTYSESGTSEDVIQTISDDEEEEFDFEVSEPTEEQEDP